jgi:hypothetical protein
VAPPSPGLTSEPLLSPQPAVSATDKTRAALAHVVLMAEQWG